MAETRLEGKRQQNKAEAKSKRQKRIAELPSDLIIDILSWLPAKSLLRFRSVSKNWYKLFSDHWFVHLHSQRAKQYLKFLYITRDVSDIESCTLRFTSTDSEGRVLEVFTKQGFTEHDAVKRVATYNDIICFKAISQDSNHAPVYVCNPATRELLALPEGSPSVGPPDLSYPRVGFGFLSSSKEYKVVRLFFTRLESVDGRYEVGNYEIGCEIFSFRTQERYAKKWSSTWRVIDEKCPYPLDDRSIFVNDCFYWGVDCNLDGQDGDFMVCLDLKNEKFRTLPLPRTEIYTVLIDLEGKLGLADFNIREKIIKIWTPKDYDKCIWIEAYKIDLKLTGIIRRPGFNCVPRCMVNGELLFVPHDDERIYCNLEKQEFRRVEALENEGEMFPYWDSIVSL